MAQFWRSQFAGERRGEIRSISSGRIIEGKRGKGKGVMEDGGGEILLDSAIWPEGKRKEDFSTIECARKRRREGRDDALGKGNDSFCLFQASKFGEDDTNFIGLSLPNMH
jgi:hypothetical protein